MTSRTRLLSILMLMLSLVVPAMNASAHRLLTGQEPSPTGVSVPRVQINDVSVINYNSAGANPKKPSSTGGSGGAAGQLPGPGTTSKNNTSLNIHVSWGPQSSQDVEVFIQQSVVTLEVRFSDGTSQTVSKRVDSLNVAALSFGSHGAATPQSFKATLHTGLKVVASVVTTRDFSLVTGSESGPGAPSASSPHPSGQLPTAKITNATFTSQCSPTRDCVDVKWAVERPQTITIKNFDVATEVTYQGIARKVTLSGVFPLPPLIDGSQTQTRMVVNNPPAGLSAKLIKVTLKTFFSPPDVTQVVHKEGTFR